MTHAPCVPGAQRSRCRRLARSCRGRTARRSAGVVDDELRRAARRPLGDGARPRRVRELPRHEGDPITHDERSPRAGSRDRRRAGRSRRGCLRLQRDSLCSRPDRSPALARPFVARGVERCPGRDDLRPFVRATQFDRSDGARGGRGLRHRVRRSSGDGSSLVRDPVLKQGHTAPSGDDGSVFLWERSEADRRGLPVCALLQVQ